MIPRVARSVIFRRGGRRVRFVSSGEGGGDGGGGDSVTYSGGHALDTSQGGFYGSGGARSVRKDAKEEHRPEALAHENDVKALRKLMDEINEMENELEGYGPTDGKYLELKNNIRRNVSNADTIEVCHRNKGMRIAIINEMILVAEQIRD